MPEVAVPSRVRLDSLTSLRFFAAAVVVVHHATTSLRPFPGAARLTAVGFLGVDFFFVLSGFVLAWTWQSSLATRHFYGRRLARVYPLHVLTAGVALLLGPPVANSAGTPQVIANLALVQAWPPVRSWFYSVNPVSWSLSVEAFFYLSFPVLIVVVQRLARPLRAIAWVCGALALVVVVVHLLPFSHRVQYGLLYTDPLFRGLEFAAGLLLARHVRLVPAGARSIGLRTAGLLVVGSYVVASVANGMLLPTAGPGPRDVTAVRSVGLPKEYATLIALPALIALVLAAARSDLSGRPSLLRRPGLVRLGEWSFALYLSHLLLLRALVDAVGPLRGAPVRLAFEAVFVVLAVGLAAVLHLAVERPAERRLRRRLGGGGPRLPGQPLPEQRLPEQDPAPVANRLSRD